MNDRVLRLEEKVAYLERHVTEQDKAMLELTELMERLRAELKVTRDRVANQADDGDTEHADERPPHY